MLLIANERGAGEGRYTDDFGNAHLSCNTLPDFLKSTPEDQGASRRKGMQTQEGRND